MNYEYTVVQATDLRTLVLNVNNLLKNGWEVAGGIAGTVLYNKEEVFAQALVRKLPS